MGRLFGTDGVRGVANETLTAELAMRIGRAAAMVLSGSSRTLDGSRPARWQAAAMRAWTAARL